MNLRRWCRSWKKNTTFITSVFLSSFNGFASDLPPDTNFQTAYHQKHFALAREILLTSLQGSPSSAGAEAYYNLALTYAGEKSWGEATEFFVKSLQERGLQVRAIARDLNQLSLVEKRNAIPNPLSEQLKFRLSFFLNADVLWLVIAIGLWAVLFAFLSRILLFREHHILNSIYIFLAITSGLLLATGFWANNAQSDLAVIVGNAPVYKQREQGDYLLDLPPGTLVQFGSHEGEEFEITQPVSGWISQENAKFLPAQRFSIF